MKGEKRGGWAIQGFKIMLMRKSKGQRTSGWVVLLRGRSKEKDKFHWCGNFLRGVVGLRIIYANEMRKVQRMGDPRI